ncbi:hypothetical protein PSPO01_02786 [Paraphaeosphaeria sporulosa]
MNPNLPNLPTELLQQVVEYTRVDDQIAKGTTLPALRLTCKSLYVEMNRLCSKLHSAMLANAVFDPGYWDNAMDGINPPTLFDRCACYHFKKFQTLGVPHQTHSAPQERVVQWYDAPISQTSQSAAHSFDA